jgi:hypothetical protein
LDIEEEQKKEELEKSHNQTLENDFVGSSLAIGVA